MRSENGNSLVFFCLLFDVADFLRDSLQSLLVVGVLDLQFWRMVSKSAHD